jgi:hypothetical protein
MMLAELVPRFAMVEYRQNQIRPDEKEKNEAMTQSRDFSVAVPQVRQQTKSFPQLHSAGI